MPKHIEQTDWIQYAHKGIVDGVEQRFPIPFLDGLLIVSQRLGILGTHIKCHSQGIKSMMNHWANPVILRGLILRISMKHRTPHCFTSIMVNMKML